MKGEGRENTYFSTLSFPGILYYSLGNNAGSHFVTTHLSPSVPNKVPVSQREWVALCAGGTGIGKKKSEWVKIDKAGCSDPRGGVGKAVPHTFCVLLQHMALILADSFIS